MRLRFTALTAATIGLIAWPAATRADGVDQLSWQRAPSPRVPGFEEPLAYDSVRNRLVLVEQGADGGTFEWDGTNWTRAAGATPVPASQHGMAFDPVRKRMVLFEGDTGVTWEWDGTKWASLAATGPTARRDAAMTYDPTRKRVVLFGGSTASGTHGDLWGFDGTAWTKISDGPTGLATPTIAVDEARARLVVISSETTAEMQEFDGTKWTKVSDPAIAKALTTDLVWDPNRRALVLFGLGAAYDETWVYNGTFTKVSTTGGGDRLLQGHLFFDARTKALGMIAVMEFDNPGGKSPTQITDLLELEGSAWSAKNAGLTAPESGHRSIYDPVRKNVVVFGLWYGVTWLWDGKRWRYAQHALEKPTGRNDHAMAFDTVRNVVVMSGGYLWGNPDYASEETWTFDGTTWTLAASSLPGGPRVGHSMVMDENSGRVLLFGGSAGTGAYDPATYGWDGSSWSSLSTSGPSGRFAPSLAWDAKRKRVVLFGGYAKGAMQNDTWEWDGHAWSQVLAPTSPPARYDAPMTFDAERGVVVMAGGSADIAGSSAGTVFDDTWAYDGTMWTKLTIDGPPARVGSSMAYHAATKTSVLFGGQTSKASLSDTWLLSAPSTPPDAGTDAGSQDGGGGDAGATGGGSGGGSGCGCRTTTSGVDGAWSAYAIVAAATALGARRARARRMR
jgi:hypothetical protein